MLYEIHIYIRTMELTVIKATDCLFINDTY